MKAYLALEDGAIFEGESFGFPSEKGAEVVFNTSLTGYQEILTDPSYKGQIMVMTYPHIGNYGINDEDMESTKCHMDGFIVKEYCNNYSNFRGTSDLGSFLNENKIIGISGIETRALVRRIREKGAMRGYIACGEFSEKYLLSKVKEVPSMEGLNLAKEVSVKKEYFYEGDKSNDKKGNVVVIDCGVKTNILRKISACGGYSVRVVPCAVSAKEILDLKPDGVVLSNGPGDPSVVNDVRETLKGLLGKLPIFGICLGHQILSLALGAKTFKLKFGHRGANHPVLDVKTKKVEITSQNHGFAVEKDSFPKENKEFGRLSISHINLNDQTVEGIECLDIPAFSVQYHPEASPGPHDSSYLFDRFFEMMDRFKKGNN